MINSEKFKDVFGLYATELWAMPNEDFVKWINAEYKETKLEPSPHPEREKTKRVIKGDGTNDLISRQAGIDAITARADRCAENFSTDDPFWEGLVIAKSIINGLPPVQASTSVQTERKKGKWIYYEQRESRYDIEGVKTYAAVYRCSECGFLHTVIEDFGRYKFCPNCGADMRGEQDEN